MPKKGKKEEDFAANRKMIEKVAGRPENSHCMDCNAMYPSWASTNFGIFVCIRCSGFHRQMGAHISKVKSISLDKWTTDMIHWMDMIGNLRGRECYMVDHPANERPNENTNDFTLENYIRKKWEHKEWFSPQALQSFAPVLYKAKYGDASPPKPKPPPSPAPVEGGLVGTAEVAPVQDEPEELTESKGLKKAKKKAKKAAKKKKGKKQSTTDDNAVLFDTEELDTSQNNEMEQSLDIIDEILTGGSSTPITATTETKRQGFGLDDEGAKVDPLASMMSNGLEFFLDIKPNNTTNTTEQQKDAPPASGSSPAAFTSFEDDDDNDNDDNNNNEHTHQQQSEEEVTQEPAAARKAKKKAKKAAKKGKKGKVSKQEEEIVLEENVDLLAPGVDDEPDELSDDFSGFGPAKK